MIKIKVENEKKRQEIKKFVEKNGGRIIEKDDPANIYADFRGVALRKKRRLINEIEEI